MCAHFYKIDFGFWMSFCFSVFNFQFKNSFSFPIAIAAASILLCFLKTFSLKNWFALIILNFSSKFPPIFMDVFFQKKHFSAKFWHVFHFTRLMEWLGKKAWRHLFRLDCAVSVFFWLEVEIFVVAFFVLIFSKIVTFKLWRFYRFYVFHSN